MKSDVNGCSTCPNGEERYEFWTSNVDGKTRVQYDFRTTKGRLFSCVAPTLEAAREKRDKWLKKGG